MTHEGSFGIASAGEFFRIVVLPQYEDFLANNSSARHALLTTIVAYHMYEWVHKRKFTAEHFCSAYPGNSALAEVFELARRISNGTKHFLADAAQTRKQSGFSSGFNEGFAKPLVIKLDDGSEKSADALLREIVDFWRHQAQAGAF